MMIAVIAATVALTYIVPAGKFARHDEFDVAGTYKEIAGSVALPRWLRLLLNPPTRSRLSPMRQVFSQHLRLCRPV